MPTNNELDLIVPDNNVSYEDKMNSFLIAKGVEGTGAYNPDYKCIDILPQDPEYIGFNLYLCSQLAQTTLASNATLNGTTIVVTSATGITTGKAINISQGARIYQSLVTNVTGTTITLASPIDYAFTAGAGVCSGNWNLNQNGSVTPLIFQLQPPPDAKFHITSITITINDDATMDDGKFGGIVALANGVVARRVDGTTFNYFIVTNNGGIYEAGYEKNYNDRAGGTGVYGVDFRKKLLEINGSVIDLVGATQDQLQFIVRDNLTTLTKFTVVAHGHIVED